MNSLARELLFLLPPEAAHRLSVQALKSGVFTTRKVKSSRLGTSVAGLKFPNPLGIAAGYDKDAEVPAQLIGLGFGFVEIGSVTPLPQPGNPKPRIFRLRRDRAVINRLGFNNRGHAACLKRLAASRKRDENYILGINVGANKTSEDKIADYEKGIGAFAELASYFTINISSPNTPGLRDLQTRERLAELLGRVKVRRNQMAEKTGSTVPLFLKVAPDLDEQDLDDIASEVERHGIEGLVVSNTTLDRQGLTETRLANQSGGLSGRPLFEKSTSVLAKMRKRCGADLAIIGVGGVDSTETALEKIRAGADLVQLYTGFVYGGPTLPNRIIMGLERYAASEGLKNLSEIRDVNVDKWAARPV